METSAESSRHGRTVLVVDDEPSQRQLFAESVRQLGFAVIEAGSGEEAVEIASRRSPDLVLLDVRLPGISGLEALRRIREGTPDLPVLLITAYADVRDAVAALKSGACDYLTKPVDLEELKTAILDQLGESHDKASGVAELPPLPPDIVFADPAFRRVLETSALVAPTEAPVLILGPSGSGKDVIARLICRWSRRAEGPFVAANCAGLPETLIESELFGHVKGAFTGAQTDRKGYFRAAHGGTLFLDEIGELPLHLQAKLLRVLENGEITPVGSDQMVRVDFRLIAATHRDLTEAVAEGRFREDLFYRLNVFELRVPPLRERREDILPLARHFAAQFAGRPVRFSPQAASALLAHPWQGNVRELRNAVQRACLLARGDVVLPEHLPPQISRTVEGYEDRQTGRLDLVERAAILATLEECGGNRTLAARKLGISRRTLIYKLRAIEEEKNAADGA
ncbi:MAG: sigma-54-dependent Fis family transcriptional regulator [Thermogutta sp.]|nr:sigma-54-dependent Fis family transcriptional regulator [Thermogutta sp.]